MAKLVLYNQGESYAPVAASLSVAAKALPGVKVIEVPAVPRNWGAPNRAAVLLESDLAICHGYPVGDQDLFENPRRPGFVLVSFSSERMENFPAPEVRTSQCDDGVAMEWYALPLRPTGTADNPSSAPSLLDDGAPGSFTPNYESVENWKRLLGALLVPEVVSAICRGDWTDERAVSVRHFFQDTRAEDAEGLQRALYLMCQGYLVTYLDPATGEVDNEVEQADNAVLVPEILTSLGWTDVDSSVLPTGLADGDARKRLRSEVQRPDWWKPVVQDVDLDAHAGLLDGVKDLIQKVLHDDGPISPRVVAAAFEALDRRYGGGTV